LNPLIFDGRKLNEIGIMNYCKLKTIVYVVVLLISLVSSCLYAIDCPIGDIDGDCIVGMSDLIGGGQWIYPGRFVPNRGWYPSGNWTKLPGRRSGSTGLHPGQMVGDPFGGRAAVSRAAAELDGVDDFVTISRGAFRQQSADLRRGSRRHPFVPFVFWGDTIIPGGYGDQLAVTVPGRLAGRGRARSVVNTGEWVHVAAVCHRA
jgi:hypothetical protein